MSEEIFLVLDFNTVCRFCLRSSGALSDLFLPEEGLPLSIPDQVHSLMDIEISPTDGFPDKLCHRCRFKIEICFEFKEMVLRTQKVLTDNTVEEILYSQTTSPTKDNKSNIQETTIEDQTEQLNEDNQTVMYDDQTDPQLTENQIILQDNETTTVDNTETELDYASRDDFNLFLIKKSNSLQSEEHFDEQTNYIETNDSNKTKAKRKSDKMDEYPSLFTARRRNQCLLCLEKCGNREILREHIQNHLVGTGLEPYYMFGERDLLCSLCNREFGYRFSFIIHQREHLNLKPFVCQHIGCNNAYSSVYRLRNHLLVHADKRFGCSFCKIKFQRKSDLRAHEIIHIDEGHKFQCSVCKLVCKNRRTLGAHVRKHYTTPRFKCETCSKAYLHRSELERHAHIHSSEKRFRCSMCASAYYSRTALVRHEKTHSQANSSIKKFCPLRACISQRDSMFDTWQGYKDHMENHPTTDYPYCCLNCNRGFIARSSLTKHMMSCCPTVMSDIVAEDSDQHHNNVEKTCTFVQMVQLEEDVKENDDNMDDVFENDDEEQLLIIKK